MKCVVKTKRITIRPLERGDFQAWKVAHLNVAPQRNIWDHSEASSEELKYGYFLKLVRGYKTLREQDRTYILGIFLNTTGEYLGTVDIMDIRRGKVQTAHMGISLLNTHWSKGIGTEVGKALPPLIFQKIGLHRIEGAIEAKNKRSVNLVKSLGFRKEGIKRKAAFLRGAWVDLTFYAATAEDFGIRWQGKF